MYLYKVFLLSSLHTELRLREFEEIEISRQSCIGDCEKLEENS
jgi:hypothetical protein